MGSLDKLNQQLEHNVSGSNKIQMPGFDPKFFIKSNNPKTQLPLSAYHQVYRTDFNIKLIVDKLTEAKAREKLLKIVDTLMDLHYIRDNKDFLHVDTVPFALGRALHGICVHTDIIMQRLYTSLEPKLGEEIYKSVEPFFLVSKSLPTARDHLEKLSNIYNIIDRKALVASNLKLEEVEWFTAFSLPFVEVSAGLSMPIQREPVFYSPSFNIWKHYTAGLFNARIFASVLEDYGEQLNNESLKSAFLTYMLKFNAVLDSVREIIKAYDTVELIDFNLLLDIAIEKVTKLREENDKLFTDWKDNIANYEASRNNNGLDNNVIYFGGSLDKTILVLQRMYMNFADKFMYARLLQMGVEKSSILFTQNVTEYMIELFTFSLSDAGEGIPEIESPVEKEEEVIFNNGIFYRPKYISALIEGILRDRERDVFERIVEAYERNMIREEELFQGFNFILSIINKHFNIMTRAHINDRLGLYKFIFNEIKSFLKTFNQDNFIVENLTMFAIHILDYVLLYSILDDPEAIRIGEDGGLDHSGVQLPCFKYKRALVVGILDKSENLDSAFSNFRFNFTSRNTLSLRSDMHSLLVELDRLRNPVLEEIIPTEDPELLAKQVEARARNKTKTDIRDCVLEADRMKAEFRAGMFEYSCCMRPDSDKSEETIKAINNAWFRFNNKEQLAIQEMLDAKKQQEEESANQTQKVLDNPLA